MTERMNECMHVLIQFLEKNVNECKKSEKVNVKKVNE